MAGDGSPCAWGWTQIDDACFKVTPGVASEGLVKTWTFLKLREARIDGHRSPFVEFGPNFFFRRFG